MRPKKGQSMIEFAIVLPLFFFIFFSTAYFCIYMNEYFTIRNAMYAAARQASFNTPSQYDDLANSYSEKIVDLTSDSLYAPYDYDCVTIQISTLPPSGKNDTVTAQIVTASVKLYLNDNFSLYFINKELLPQSITISCDMPAFNSAPAKSK